MPGPASRFPYRSAGLLVPCLAFLIVVIAPSPAQAQFIDFETLPGGASTIDLQEITDQYYAEYGVTFTLLDRVTGEPSGAPLIAKAGPPQTAFVGCYDADTPLPHIDLGVSFLTDGNQVGIEGDLLIEYATPVALASGVILDIDCRTAGGPPCEQWTITAHDGDGNVLETVVIDAPPGPINPQCLQPETGPGDAEAFGWYVSDPVGRIESIILRYTGAADNVGLAFDSFSVAGVPGPPEVTLASTATTVCPGETVVLAAVIAGGLPPFTHVWQKNAGSGWLDIGWSPSETIRPVATASYRLVVTDALNQETVSPTLDVVVTPDDPLCETALLVSSYDNDRVVRFGYQSGLSEVFVSNGSGGLNGPSKLVCHDDGLLYVSSQLNDRVQRYDGTTGDFVDVFVTGGSGGLNVPIGLDFGPDGNLYVASYTTDSVLRYSGADGSFIDAFVTGGSGGLNGPTGLVFGPDDDLFVCSRDNHRVLRYDGATGTPLGDFVTAGSGGLANPRGLVFGPDGHFYVSSESSDNVLRYDGATGAFIDVFVTTGAGGLERANDVLFGPDGRCYVISTDTDQVLVYDGTTGTTIGALPGDLLEHPGWLAIGCTAAISATPPPAPAVVEDLRVEPGVPNPFNPRTTVDFVLARPGSVTVSVLDLRGRVVATLLDRFLVEGRHAVEWDGRTSAGLVAPSGVYFMHVQSGAASRAAKLMLVR